MFCAKIGVHKRCIDVILVSERQYVITSAQRQAHVNLAIAVCYMQPVGTYEI